MENLSEHKYTILVIDDKPENIKLLLKVLTEAGYETLMAKDGMRGLQRAIYAKPDLILLDIMMPEISGFEVCRQLKQQPETQDIPVVFMSALQDTIDKVEGFELGAADYISKPFHHEEVLARIKTHLQIYSLQRNLKQRNLELDTFARSVAHDLKNPLNIILNYAELLNDTQTGQPFTHELHEHCAAILRAGRKMISTINELLTLAGLSRAPVELKPIEMAQVIEQVLQNKLALMIKETQAHITLPETWPQALGHAPWLEEVWLNYLSNGIKYGGVPPRLQLGAEIKDEKTLCFWVQDNGPGIDSALQEQIFTPFIRADYSHADGYGLGLSIVQHIIHKLGGQVGVQSQSGQGSRFYFCLPRAFRPNTTETQPLLFKPPFTSADCALTKVQIQHIDDFIELGDINGLDFYLQDLIKEAEPSRHSCLIYLKQLVEAFRLDACKAFLHISSQSSD